MDDLILDLGLALAIGLLVGLERGWRDRDDPAGSRTAGIRTFGIAGLLGGVMAALAEAFGAPLLLAAGLLGFAAVFAWFGAQEAAHEGSFSVTATVAALLVFALGALAVAGDRTAAAAGGAALAAVLAGREMLHGLLRRLTWVELRSAVVLAAMTAIVLPLLPDRALDPWGGFNPHEVWLFTVLVAAISYAGYVAVRVLGPTRGIVVSALAGALVSSTAVTLAFARRARETDAGRQLAGAAALAAVVSVLRVLAVAALLRPAVLAAAAPAALAGAAVFGLGGLLLLRRADPPPEGAAAARNPFELPALLGFAALFALVSTLSAAAVARFGAASLLASAALAGSFDADVAVLSALRQTDAAVGLDLIGLAVLAALAANAAGRLLLAAAAGPRAYWLPLAGTSAAAVAAGAAVLILLA
ncbi:MgtC/SapB family protein [Ruixingdingia sedimenti]|uniref:DUF4010 domain-containing protein n=1 Tax=Ruixingdingia sedimenti TaxID=3073604 RepID=A0ABU1F3P0_9RHOB|nr:DUF4010 domain-containing protein [Xinfangfangia sp. LG-4]MDR5651476.1 DUF4010 domain-containing protein [Xinfangfangia sp. LG-4]